MGRNEINEKNVFDNIRYRNIIFLISQSENIRAKIDLIKKPTNEQVTIEGLKRVHLRLILCKKHGLDISERQKNRLKKEINFNQWEIVKWQYKQGLISKKIYNNYKKIKDLDQEQQMILAGNLNPKYKFATAGSLNTALSRLKNKLELIDTKKSKKGYDYYILTPKGYIEWSRWFCKHRLIDFVPNDENLMARLQVLLKNFLRDECKSEVF